MDAVLPFARDIKGAITDALVEPEIGRIVYPFRRTRTIKDDVVSKARVITENLIPVYNSMLEENRGFAWRTVTVQLVGFESPSILV